MEWPSDLNRIEQDVPRQVRFQNERDTCEVEDGRPPAQEPGPNEQRATDQSDTTADRNATIDHSSCRCSLPLRDPHSDECVQRREAHALQE